MSHNEKAPLSITLEDVQSAILVLTEFMKKQRDAERIFRQMGLGKAGSNRMPSSAEGMMSYLFEGIKAKQATEKGGVEPEAPAMTEEDLKRMHEISENRKKPKPT